MRYVTLREALWLHARIIEQSGGGTGVRDLGALESALAQPRMSFGGEDLYPSVVEKASAVAFSLVMNHPFVDGNKRIGHAVMATFLQLNGWRIEGTVDEQERLFLDLAAGLVEREALTEWVRSHVHVER